MSHIVVLPGDGIGPEVTAEARQCLQLLSDRCGLGLTFEERDFGGIAIDRHGVPLPAETLEACKNADAILAGAVGGPQWDACEQRPEAGLLQLRAKLGLFANLRPSRVLRGLEHLSPLKKHICTGADVLVVRELTGGAYFGEKHYRDDYASDLCVYTRDEIERIAHVAFRAARRRNKRLTSVDKANVLETFQFWKDVVTAVHADYPDVALDHMYVDNAAMQLVRAPKSFDVVVTGNMFGDILSDEAAMLTGSIGMLPSASLDANGKGLYEPSHGSAPDIAGKDLANPLATILSVAMMLRFTLDQPEAAARIEQAVQVVLKSGLRTADIWAEGTQKVGTRAMGDAVVAALAGKPITTKH